jgi:hypothetical protein
MNFIKQKSDRYIWRNKIFPNLYSKILILLAMETLACLEIA